jgi:hypothetical protein
MIKEYKEALGLISEINKTLEESEERMIKKMEELHNSPSGSFDYLRYKNKVP